MRILAPSLEAPPTISSAVKKKKKRAAEEISASSHETGRNGRERKWS
jgi:hypothetical protein